MTGKRILSINQNSTMHLDFEKSLRAYCDANIEGVGISLKKLMEYGVEKGINLLNNLPINPTHTIFAGPFNQNTEKDYIEARKVDEEKIQITKEIGSDTLLAIAGPINGLAKEKAEEQLIRGLKEISKIAEKENIKVGIEPIHFNLREKYSFICSLAKALDIINSVDCSNAGIIFDLYHLWQEPGLLDTIEMAKGKIIGCHISDWRPIQRKPDDRVLMGDGCIPIKEIIKALEDFGWNKWYDVEIFNDDIWGMDVSDFLSECIEKFNSLIYPERVELNHEAERT